MRRPLTALLAMLTLTGLSFATDSFSGDDAAPPGEVELLVVAPHPDDETLLAAGLLARAARGDGGAAVAVVTNGDYTCERDGYLREREAVAALGRLGVAEHDLFFLGYPDGHLARLGATPIAPVERRDEAGRCVADNRTYANRGAASVDWHAAFAGDHAGHDAGSLVGDLAALIERLRPRDIVVTHPIDTHLDHAFTYAYLRRALERAGLPSARLHRGVVHLGGCWPVADGDEPCPAVELRPDRPMPPLPGPLAGYVPSERVAVPDELRAAAPDENPKYLAIASYRSQIGQPSPLSYLFSFVRSDEIFFPETLRRDETGALVRAPAPGVGPGHVALEATWARAARRATRRGTLRAPLRCELITPARPAGGRPELGAAASLRVLASGGDGSAYALRVAPEGESVSLWREQGGRARPLRTWPLPDDDRRASAHRYELRVDPRPDDGGVAELTVRRDGEVLGVAVDPAPLLAGDHVSVEGEGELLPLLEAARCWPVGAAP